MLTAAERTDRMLETAPDYYERSQVYKAILEAWAGRVVEGDEGVEDLRLQLNIQTVTWAIDLWEKDYAVKRKTGDTLAIRRSRVLGKIQGMGTFTKAAALNLANTYSEGGTARFRSLVGQYAFLTIHEFGDLIDFEAMVAAFREMKPAHLRHVVGLIANDGNTLEIESTVKVTRSTYHTVEEFKVGMAPGKSYSEVTL